ncbi:MAG: polysaccharide biosynthesis tyrosine autokinase [Methylococcaceae bacterium]|nr:polysaccharide biosynthesis tyrosine autokinase [Methylococcaceae bacterium]
MSNPFSVAAEQANDDQANEKEDFDWGDIFAAIQDDKYTVMAVFGLLLSLGVAKAFTDMPVYRADAMMQVQDRSSSIQALEPVDFFMESHSSAVAEIEIARSRRVLSQTIRELDLDIVAKPRYFPLIGEALAYRFRAASPDRPVADAWFGQSQYAWGGESLKIGELTLPEDWLGRELLLVAGEPGRFSLRHDGRTLLEGRVGEPQQIALPGGSATLSLTVAGLTARPGTQFIIGKKPMIVAISQLSSSLVVAETARNSGILNFSLESPAADLAAAILDRLIKIYLRENVQQKLGEADQSLEFLDSQLPSIKKQLEAAVTALNDFKSKNSSIDLNIETQNLLAAEVDTKKEITLLQEKKDELRAKFTESYPAVVAIDRQIARLRAQMADNEKSIESLPDVQRVILGLTRDVEVNTALYTTLLQNTQTLRVAKAGTIGNVHIIDPPIKPLRPLKPNRPLIVVLAAAAGLVAGIGAVFLRKALARGIANPGRIRKALQLPIYAVVPHSRAQQKTRPRRPDPHRYILAGERKEDSAVESLRSLRAALQFALAGAPNKVILIAGAKAANGKTFVAANLAVVLADGGGRVLLVDGDLRKGDSAGLLGINPEPGLSEYLSGTVPGDGLIRTLAEHAFDYLPTGMLPPNPAELLAHPRCAQLFGDLTGKYDYVLVDSPPLLSVSDATLLGRLAGTILLVVKARHDSVKDLEQSLHRLAQAELRPKGVVFNDARQTSASYGDGYVPYRYRSGYGGAA